MCVGVGVGGGVVNVYGVPDLHFECPLNAHLRIQAASFRTVLVLFPLSTPSLRLLLKMCLYVRVHVRVLHSC